MRTRVSVSMLENPQDLVVQSVPTSKLQEALLFIQITTQRSPAPRAREYSQATLLGETKLTNNTEKNSKHREGYVKFQPTTKARGKEGHVPSSWLVLSF